MMRTALAACLSLIVALPVSASAQGAAPAAAKPAPPKTIVQLVRDAIAENDFVKAEKLVLDDINAKGTTPIAIEAFSWLGRGHVAAKRYDQAMTYAARTYEIVEEQLKTRKLDDEPRLPIALGAAIEVQALATAGQGNRSEAVIYLRAELDTYKDTSIVERINKNINLLSLEGTPAYPIAANQWIGAARPIAEAIRGKPTVLYLWAHWCGDCKKQGPVLEALVKKYQSTGLTLVAPTKLYGYVAQRKPAAPEAELAYIKTVVDEFYPWLAGHAVPVSAQVFEQYGVSTTPTLVLIDRDGKVATYHPGQMTVEQLEPLIQKIAGPTGTSSRQ
jgi:thiol-disulfide isomerase/thioredoxin